MRELENVRNSILQIFDSASWIQFIHEGLLPAYTSQEKAKNVIKGNLSSHCAICRNINRCCFPKNNMPKYPLHPNCHCYLLDIPRPQVTAECPEEKFERYIFSPEYVGNGKIQLYTKWGYGKINTKYLVNELTRQADKKYSNGDFELGLLNEYGQRISIVTELNRLDGKGIVKFLTGWMVYPDGKIQLTTPYGGEVK
ncbi:MAG: hypothetical protein K2O86_06150 [Clostridia bacterium]|nr:hypothetical protein [Clostridia bacterium]